MIRNRFPYRSIVLCAAVSLALTALSAAGREGDAVDREFRFASGLVELGFSDFAEDIVRRLLADHPDRQDQARLVRARVLIEQRDFGAAREIVREMDSASPQAQAIQLALANALYRFGRVDEAHEIYEVFFGQYEDEIPEDPDLLQFFRESAFTFGRMLLHANRYAAAHDVFGRVLASEPERGITRTVKVEQAEAALRQAEVSEEQAERNRWMERTLEICEDIQWGGLDVPFGQSIMIMARIELLRGNRQQASDLLRSNIDILREIDDLLEERGMSMRRSPMAGARYMLAEIYEQQAGELGDTAPAARRVELLGDALKEYFTVFARYGESDWGVRAGVRAEELKAELEGMGRTVRVDLGKYAAQAAENRFRLARDMYRRGDYREAIKAYLDLHEAYPEGERSVEALGTLAQAYAAIGNDLYAQAVLAYLGERYSGHPDAAMAHLRLGKWYYDREESDQYYWVYERYLDYFPDHDRAPAILFSLAGMAAQQGDRDRQEQYLGMIVERYPGDRNYLRALSRLAWNYYTDDDHQQAVKFFADYIDALSPGHERARAQFSMADSYRQMDDYESAIQAYRLTLQWLEDEDGPYYSDPDEVADNRELRRDAMFFLAHSLTRITGEEEEVAAYRERGVEVLNQFLDRYPEDELAPRAMNNLGRTQLSMERYDAAVTTFDRLAENYPDSPEGRNALFSLVRAALEVDMRDVAVDALGRMLAGAGDYSPGEFVRVGQLMLDHNLYREAIDAYEMVWAETEERRYLERALYGIGVAHFELEQYDQAVVQLEELMDRYPQSGLFYESKFMLGMSYRELRQASEAIAALSDVFRYSEDPVLINRANRILAQVRLDQGNKPSALAAYQRIALLADPDNPELRPLIRESILESIPIAMELERYRETVEICEQFLEEFPNDEKVAEVREIRAEANLRAIE